MTKALDFSVGDLHCGHKSGLFYDNGELDYRARPFQKWSWQMWEHNLLPAVEKLIKDNSFDHKHLELGGDLVDLDYKNRSQYYWTRDESEAVDNVCTALEPLVKLFDSVHVIRGTPSHTGGMSKVDEAVAKNFDNVIGRSKHEKSWYRVDYKLAGVLVNAQHVGRNKSKWGEGNALNTMRDEMILERTKNGQPIPDVMWRHHYHYPYITSTDRTPIVAQVASWCGEGEYEPTIDPIGRMPVIGAAYGIYEDGKVLEMREITYSPESEKAWQPKSK